MSGPTVVATTRGRFRVREHGRRGDPVVLLVAGLGDDLTTWDVVVPHLGDLYCISMDNRGCGGSDTPRGPYAIADLAEDCVAVLDAMGVRADFVVGSSMGGAVVQHLLITGALSVRAAVVSNSWARGDTRTDLVFDHWISMAREGREKDLRASTLLLGLAPAHFLAEGGDVLDGLDIDLVGFEGGAWACRTHDLLARLPEISAPVLVIAGALDVLTPPQLSARISAALPVAELAVLETGHMTYEEDPVRWAGLVRRWFDHHRHDSAEPRWHNRPSKRTPP